MAEHTDEVELDPHERELIAGVGLDPDNPRDVEYFYQIERENELAEDKKWERLHTLRDE